MLKKGKKSTFSNGGPNVGGAPPPPPPPKLRLMGNKYGQNYQRRLLNLTVYYSLSGARAIAPIYRDIDNVPCQSQRSNESPAFEGSFNEGGVIVKFCPS